MADVRQCPRRLGGDVEVGGVGPEPCLVHARLLERERERGHAREHQEQQREHRVVQREDAERPPGIEIAEVVPVAFGIQQEARDQESGEDEEGVHPEDAVVAQLHCQALSEGARRGVPYEMDRHHHQDGEPAHSVEPRKLAGNPDRFRIAGHQGLIASKRIRAGKACSLDAPAGSTHGHGASPKKAGLPGRYREAGSSRGAPDQCTWLVA